MFIGHYAVALAAKKFAPQVSLGILFLACQLADMASSSQSAVEDQLPYNAAI